MNELVKLEVQAVFDYQALDVETRVVVQQRTSEIRVLVKRAAQDIIDIGQKLIEVKDRLGHGNFGKWLEAEFDWSHMTAARFMQVGEQFKLNNLLGLEIGASALYLLASPSTPEPARIEAVERAETGERITYSVAQGIVAWHKAPAISDTTPPTFEEALLEVNDALQGVALEMETRQFSNQTEALKYYCDVANAAERTERVIRAKLADHLRTASEES